MHCITRYGLYCLHTSWILFISVHSPWQLIDYFCKKNRHTYQLKIVQETAMMIVASSLPNIVLLHRFVFVVTFCIASLGQYTYFLS